MEGLSLSHLLLLSVVVLVVFGGKGRISNIMGDVAKGIKSFKKGLAEDDAPPPSAEPQREIAHQAQPVLETSPDAHKAG